MAHMTDIMDLCTLKSVHETALIDLTPCMGSEIRGNCEIFTFKRMFKVFENQLVDERFCICVKNDKNTYPDINIFADETSEFIPIFVTCSDSDLIIKHVDEPYFDAHLITFKFKNLMSQFTPMSMEMLKEQFYDVVESGNDVNELTVNWIDKPLFFIKWITVASKKPIHKRDRGFSSYVVNNNELEDPDIDDKLDELVLTDINIINKGIKTHDFSIYNSSIVDIEESNKTHSLLFNGIAASTPKAVARPTCSPLYVVSHYANKTKPTYVSRCFSDMVVLLINTGISLKDIGITEEQYNRKDYFVSTSSYYDKLYNMYSSNKTYVQSYDKPMIVVAMGESYTIYGEEMYTNLMYLPATTEGKQLPPMLYTKTHPSSDEETNYILQMKNGLEKKPKFLLTSYD